ncbi:SPOR domain-containing protein [Legionella impletisoli]|uniref:Sporulation protein n=1 Tax=Legionella impletisoli TaxID=343510 RepID=A0A917JLI7_9GAMM|nr:SPOR domain-containing protein [Legionella impletisoli]GGI76096.1 sporulation protein [Legionella impletisoli]
MKFTLDESRKHRLIGVVVILSVVALFLPAMMKKSNEGLNSTVNVAVRLPPKPNQPSVSKPDREQMFQTIKVAKVDLSEAIDPEPAPTQLVKAEPIKHSVTAKSEEPVQIQTKPAAHIVKASPNHPLLAHKEPIKHKEIAPKSKAQELANQLQTNKKPSEVYAVQIASFAVESNAKTLVQQLRHKGYKATYSRSTTNKRELYKVIVGQVEKREEAKELQQKLVETIHLNGFVIKTGVS